MFINRFQRFINQHEENYAKKRGGYRGKSKPKLPPHLKLVHVNARIQQWMLDQLKEQGEVDFVLEDILKVPGFKCREPEG